VNGVFLAGARTSTVGQIAYFAGTTVPGGWLEADGSLIPRATYAALWTFASASGTIQSDANWFANGRRGCFSTGDGSTTFRIPDLRGTFIRPWAHGGAIDAGRLCGQDQQGLIANHTHPASSSVNDPGHAHGYQRYNSTVGGGGGSNVWYQIGTYNTDWAYTGISVSTTTSNNTGGGGETRPYNIAEMCCISYL